MWTIDSLRIFTQDESDSFSQSIARLNPLDDYTVYHNFGFESDIKKLSAKVVGFPDRNTLIGYSRDGLTHVLSGVGIFWGNYYIKSVGTKMDSSIYQNFYVDADHDCDDPVFTCEIEMYKLET